MTDAARKLVEVNLENPHFAEMCLVRTHLITIGMRHTARMLVLDFVKQDTEAGCRDVIRRYDRRGEA